MTSANIVSAVVLQITAAAWTLGFSDDTLGISQVSFALRDSEDSWVQPIVQETYAFCCNLSVSNLPLWYLLWICMEQ